MTEPAAGSWRAVGVALALPFRAAPLTAGTQLVLTVLAGAMPAAAAWATKLMLDELSSGHAESGRVVLLALVGIVTGGLATALLYFTGYLAEVVRHRVTFTVKGRLFARTSALRGLSHVEDPAYDLTAAENIGLGRVDGIDDRAMIQAAARAAEVDAVLRALPHGYDTLLSRTHGDDTGASSRAATTS